jgi:hypothetical protein
MPNRTKGFLLVSVRCGPCDISIYLPRKVCDALLLTFLSTSEDAAACGAQVASSAGRMDDDTGTNRNHLVLFGMQNRTFDAYLDG